MSGESKLLKSVCSRNSLEIEKLNIILIRSIPLKPATEKGILSSDESFHYIFLYASVFLVSWLNFLPIYTVSLWASSLGYVGSWTKKEEKLLLCISLWLYHPYRHSHHILGNLRKSVFERPRQHAESGLFTFLSSGFANILSYIVSTSVKKLGNTNFIASRCILKKGKSPHFRLTCVFQKRLCLSSVLCH